MQAVQSKPPIYLPLKTPTNNTLPDFYTCAANLLASLNTCTNDYYITIGHNLEYIYNDVCVCFV